MTAAPLEIPVNQCRASPTARQIKPGHVLTLVESIKQIGLRQPINVRLIDGGYEVRGGGHRVEAFRYLGRETIPARICEDDDLRAELAEIDENYCRAELTPAERALSMSRRKALYELLHPETRAHVAGGKARQGAASDKLSFAEDAAQNTGKNRRTIERDTHRGSELGEDVVKAVIGTSLDKGEELDALAKLPPDKRDEVVERARAGDKVSAKVEAKKDRREGREAELGDRIRALPDQRYGLIYCDIPRHFNVRSDETGLDRSPENHYPTMTFQQLLDLPIPSIAAEDCILVFWSTAASLIDDIEIMAEWGFVTLRPREAGRLRRDFLVDGEWRVANEATGGQPYRSMQVWDKVKIGLGYWFRDRHEFVLIGARGNVVAPAQGTQDHSLFSEPKGEHSAKPDRVAEMIERLWPNIPKIELFRRGKPRPGWDAWGNQAEVPTAAAALTHDADTGEIIDPKPETQRDDTTLVAAPAPTDDVVQASAMPSCSHDGGAAEGTVTALPPHVSQEGNQLDDIPSFLRRNADNSLPKVSA